MKNFFKNNKSLILIIAIGSLFHMLFFGINEILKNADSFAYLQMSYHFKKLSLEGFGTGWFGFFYSLLIAISDSLTFWLNEYYIALYLNIILFGVGAVLLYKIGKYYLEEKYNLFLIILFYLSPILLSFNITILSENVYIPLFLGLVLFLIKAGKEGLKKTKNLFYLSLFITLFYFTRAEAFIYLGSIFIVLFFNICGFIDSGSGPEGQWKKNFIDFLKKSSLVIIFFFLLIAPYLLYLHSITGDWGLTNKGSSNLRQAELRGSEKMDDEGFEQAVGELTIDNHHLKSGFVGGLKYEKGEEKGGLKDYLLANPQDTISRILGNQIKLYTKNLPELIVGDAVKLYQKSYLFLPILLIPLFLVVFGMYKMFVRKEFEFLIIFFSFFSTASLFFTLFFVLNRYFLIFLPLFLVFIVYGLQEIKLSKIAKIICTGTLILIYLLGNYVYYNSVKTEDDKYEVKKIAGEYIKKLIPLSSKLTNLKIMERFPVVTYYSGTKERWITPYTDNLENLIEYAKFNKIDYLVVDTLDFKTYRPKLDFLLKDDFENESLHKIQTFQVNNQKVILYKFTF
ncbi:MAG: hypothetical protein WC850_03215 [Candidatus Gracilibacteria bacterium]